MNELVFDAPVGEGENKVCLRLFGAVDSREDIRPVDTVDFWPVLSGLVIGAVGEVYDGYLYAFAHYNKGVAVFVFPGVT